MTRWALALALLLMAPSAAVAREPIISYVDESGTFRLYDEELEAEIDPPPPVPAPANFLGFRYGMSLNGRYIVFNDNPAPRKLHLLDRATNTEVPLPGINIYNNPGGLTVSDAGLIAFDDNGDTKGVVYNSATGSFVDTGLAVDNGHRQTRLSGDGRFLAATCISNCIVDTGGDADAFVQNLGTKLDTAFPDDNDRSEEHPCMNGDGSLLGIDKARSATTDPKPDLFLFDRSVSPPAEIPLPGVNDADEEEVYCVLDGAGEFLGFMNAFVTFRVYHRPSAAFLGLPADKEFDRFSSFSAPYPPPPPPGGGTTTPPPPNDVTDPAVRRFRMTRRRFRPGRRATAFRFVLSEPADVRIVVRRRRGKRAGAISRADLPAGANTISFSGRFRGRALRAGRYVALLTATDAAGNVSALRSVRFRVLR